ncbi:hypothetical protein EDD27_5245 [Nonomuraea polychroma]|uniref:Uncharacterized protein n=1 Tax=Nonomuraea polychroma TaxID=46176 RepID=A0A438MA59_9ACTN|nr:hypothetical protein [Nonomuraea polychroma]RVX42609.1 hypothetical protein EDD27_5245 [Nonomuraea polychroma]
MVGACLEQDLRSLDGKLAAAGVPALSAHGLYAAWLLGYFSGFDPYLTAQPLAGTPLGAHLPRPHTRRALKGSP